MNKTQTNYKGTQNSKINNYKRQLSKAYYTGYKSGYSDANLISKTFGAKSNAVFGYRQGLTGYCQEQKVRQSLKNYVDFDNE